MEILQVDNGQAGAFYIETDGVVTGEMTYTWASPHLMVIQHTEVSDIHRGQQAGKKLVHRAVEYAREHKLKILPLCPFASAVFKKMPEYADVLSKSTR